MKKYFLLSYGLFFILSPMVLFANENDDKLLEQEILMGKETTKSNIDLNRDLNKATSGFGRFRFGMSLGVGYYVSSSIKNYPTMNSVAGELGLYTLFNPIRNWADIELGIRGLYVLPWDNNSENSEIGKEEERSYSGLGSSSVYTGVGFRLPRASSAIFIGIYKDIVVKAQFSDKQKLDTDLKNSLKYKLGHGGYVEYQWTGSENSNNLPLIPFVRLTYGSYKSEYRRATEFQTTREKLLGLMIGAKY